MKFSPTQEKILTLISDGEVYSQTDVMNVCGCSLASFQVQLARVRSKLKRLNPLLNVVTETRNGILYVQLVKITPATIDVIKVLKGETIV